MKKRISQIIILVLLAGLSVGIYYADQYNLIFPKSYTAKYFQIEIILSSVDFDEDGTDDYTDILLGAREDAINKPAYKSAYYAGGYPPDNEGVCTDVVWRAFKNAGYNLKEMVDQDIQDDQTDYFNITKPDLNIDFRRVKNLMIYFEHKAISLTLDINETSQWQPGDIVIFNGGKHIGIVSDKRNKNGQVFIIHNSGQLNRDEDYFKRNPIITGHYRFDASLLEERDLIAW